MSHARIPFSTFLAVALAMILAAPPRLLAQEAADDRTSRVLGKISDRDGKKAVAGATVHLLHLPSRQVFEAGPTGGGGRFELPQMPYGNYDLLVSTADGSFIADQIVTVEPAAKTELVVRLDPHTASATPTEADLRAFPGPEQSRLGVARIERKLTGSAFWRGPVGVGILVGAGGLVLLGIAAGSDPDEPVASPVNP